MRENRLKGTNLSKFLIVAFGGAVGAVARYWLGGLVYARWPMSFPLGTFVVNLTGSFLIGFCLALFSLHVAIHPHWRLLLVAGFAGAYTTFSTFEYEMLQLFEKGQSAMALLYLALSVITGFIAVWMGSLIVRTLFS